jgi:tetratricopeptide (TPR) repeat protein
MKRLIVFLTLLACSSAFAQDNFEFYYLKGHESFGKNNYSEAISHYDMAIKRKSTAKNQYQVANVYMARAYSKMHLKKFNNALEDINDAILIKPEFTELYLAASTIQLYNKQYDKSIAFAEDGLKLKPEYEDLILVKARAKTEKKKYEEALMDLDSLLTNINTKNIEALILKGQILRKRKEFQKGIDTYSQVINLDAQNVLAFYNRGLCKARLEDFDAALLDIERGMALDTSSHYIGNNNIAYFIKFDQKKYSEAITLLDLAIKQYPQFAFAYCNRGYAKLQLNDLKGSRVDIDKSIAIDKENAYVYKVNAQWYIASGKSKLACESLRKAIALGYNDEYDEEVNDLIKQYCN